MGGANAAVGRIPDLRYFAHHITTEGRYLPIRAAEQVFSRRLNLACEIGTCVCDLANQVRARGLIGRNGPRQRPGGHSRGVEEEHGLDGHPGQCGQEGAKQRRL